MTLVSCFNKTFETYADKVAVEFNDKKITFDELNKNSNRIANALKDIGVSKGDRVALYLANNLELIYFFTGILKNGSVVVPMNNSFKEKEVEYLLNDSGAKAILTDSKTFPIIKNTIKELNGLKYIIINNSKNNDQNSNEKSNSIEIMEYNEFIKNASDSNPNVEVTDADGSIMFYTSGTTGRSKGALLSHKNMESDLEALKQAWHLTDNDKQILTLPLFHIHGLGVALCGSFYNGYSFVLRKKFDAEEVLKLIEEKKATLFMGVPAMYIKILQVKDKEKYNTSSMRLFVSGLRHYQQKHSRNSKMLLDMKF